MLCRVPPPRPPTPAEHFRGASAELRDVVALPGPTARPSANGWLTRAPATSLRCSRRRSAEAMPRVSLTGAGPFHSQSAVSRHLEPPESGECIAWEYPSNLGRE